MATTVIRRERIISIPVDVLWQLIEPVKTLAFWLPLVERAEVISGKGLGRRQRVRGRWGSKPGDVDQEVVAYEPNARLAWTEAGGGVTFSIELESIGPGTRVVLESRIRASGTAALWLRFARRRRIGRAFDQALDTLAAAGG